MGKSNSRIMIRNIGAILYIVTLFILLMDKTDFFYYGYILRKLKYVYLLYMILYVMTTFKGYLSKKVSTLVILLLVHTCLFGLVFVNQDVLKLTRDHFREMLTYIAMIWLTYYFVWNEDLFERFLRWNFYVLSLVFMLCGIRHVSNFVNPIYFIYVFSSHHSYRSTFGFGHANFTGNMAVFTLVYSVFLLEILMKKRHKTKKDKYELYLILFCDVIVGEILLSTQSRTSIIAGITFCMIYAWRFARTKMRYGAYIELILTAGLIIVCVGLYMTGVMDSIWNNSNRDANITVNMPFFRQFSPWTGMGYIASSGFYMKAYGYATFAVDIYYLYIFLTTGYIGTIIISCYLVLCFVFICKFRHNKYRVSILALYIAILITGIGQTNMIQYTLYTSMINWILIYLSITPKKNRDYVLNI